MVFDARLSYVPLALEHIDLIDVIENVFYQFDERATRENKSIEVETPPPPAPLEADHDLLVRALSNLVDNSLKYSSTGAKVRITLEVTEVVYTLKVIDSGDGIPPELLPDRIFEALVRGRAKDGGSGLGLSIVRKIVELHRGDITAHSVVGKGTTMTLCLPR
jgi:signal transduction histidine kinase